MACWRPRSTNQRIRFLHCNLSSQALHQNQIEYATSRVGTAPATAADSLLGGDSDSDTDSLGGGQLATVSETPTRVPAEVEGGELAREQVEATITSAAVAGLAAPSTLAPATPAAAAAAAAIRQNPVSALQ